MATRAQAVQAASTRRQSVLVTSDRRTPGVRLEASGITLGETQYGDELLRYSPDFILYPDATPRSQPPWRKGREDYHPRRVEAFTDIARPYIARPRGALVVAYVACFSALAVALSVMLLLIPVVPLTYWQSPLSVAMFSLAIVVLILGWALSRRAPSVADLFRRSAVGEATYPYGIRSTSVDPPTDGRWALQSWKDYQSRVVRSDRYPRTSYARAVARDGELYLQYWQFYVFNDWYNRHEADWEVVVVRLAPVKDGWCPVAAAYSSHFGGHWRAWGELESRDGTHPVVYVARGSHAQYFESNPDGYLATLTQPVGVMEFRLRLTFQRDWRDELAAQPTSPAEHYGIVVLPQVRGHRRRGERPARTDAFWWLAYAGLWGGREAVEGPVAHQTVWNDPWNWIANETERDTAAWGALPTPNPDEPC